MQMDNRIILAGQGIDAVGAFDRGTMAGQNALAARQNVDAANLYRAQGANILAGDQSALNALAQINPDAAFAAEGNVLKREAAQFDLQQAKVQAARDTEAYMAGLDAAKAAEEAAQLRSMAEAAALANSPEQWAQVFADTPYADAWDQRGAVLEILGTQKSVVDRMFPSATANPGDRYRVVGSTLYDLQAEGGPAIVGQGAMQEETIFGPDGKPLIVRGGPGAGVKFTEAQSKDNVYATRAEGALAKLEPVATALTSVLERAAEADPTGLVRGMQSEEYQTAKQAADEFLQAILRKDTGAAITAQEQELYGKTYLPQPGDGPAVLEAKRQARIRAIEAMKAGMNIDQITATERALVNAAERAGVEPQGGYMGTPPNAAAEQPRRMKYDPATGEFK